MSSDVVTGQIEKLRTTVKRGFLKTLPDQELRCSRGNSGVKIFRTYIVGRAPLTPLILTEQRQKLSVIR